jgi:hypothetical protein
VKKPEEVMEILEAYDLAGSLRGAAQLAGCDHKTVAHWVAQRDLGLVPKLERKRPAMGVEYQRKVDELVARSHGKVRGDVAHGKLVALGYLGSSRMTPRWVDDSKRRWRREHGRITRPWTPEPGLWAQFDYGDGPVVEGRQDHVVLRVVGVVALPGRGRVARQDDRVGGDGDRPGAADVRRRADLTVD